MKTYSKQAFTLVELLIVLGIISILMIFGFLSYKGYTKNAKESARLSDVKTIDQSLSVFFLKTTKFPSPDHAVPITYSGNILWYQGTFSSQMAQVLGVNQVPLDPVNQTEYPYALTFNGSAYETAYITDGLFSSVPGVSPTYAGLSTQTKILGNYNHIYISSSIDGALVYFSVPSLILSNLSSSTHTDLLTMPDTNFTFEDKNILPSGYSQGGGNSEDDFSFISSIVYSGASNPVSDAEIISFATQIKNVYEYSDLKDEPQYRFLMGDKSNDQLLKIGKYLLGLTKIIFEGDPYIEEDTATGEQNDTPEETDGTGTYTDDDTSTDTGSTLCEDPDEITGLCDNAGDLNGDEDSIFDGFGTPTESLLDISLTNQTVSCPECY